MRNSTNTSGSRSLALCTIGNFMVSFLLIISFAHFGFSQTPTTPEQYVEIGNKQFLLGFLNDAIAFYTRAIELKPNFADAYNNRAYVYTYQANQIPKTSGTNNANDEKRLKLAKLAILDFDKAVELRPQYAVYYRNRASAYLIIDQRRAVTELTAAIEIDRKDAYTWYERCRANSLIGNSSGYDSKKWDMESVSDCTEAIRLRPDLAEAYTLRGQGNHRLLKYDLAIADYSQAIHLKPDHADAFALRSDAYRSKNQYELAVADATTAIGLRPEEPVYYQRRGWVYLIMAGVPFDGYIVRPNSIVRAAAERAVEDFTKAIQLRPNFAQPYISRATALCALGNKAQSFTDYKKATELGSSATYTCR